MARQQPLQLVPFGRLAFLGVIACFWTFVTFLRMMWSFVQGPFSYFRVKPVTQLPAIATDKSLGEHGYITVKTMTGPLKFHYVAKGPVDGPLMLLLHGFPECWFSWRHQLIAFSDTYRVVAVDNRGYAGSEKPSGVENYAIDVLASDVKGIIGALGYETCVLVAHDWGGAIAWATAAAHPQVVSQLVVLNCPHSVAMQKHVQSSFKQFLASWYMFFFQCPVLPELLLRANDFAAIKQFFRDAPIGLRFGKFTEEEMDIWRFYYSSWASINRPVNYYRAAFRYKSPLASAIKQKISMPTLIVWGTEDRALTIELARKSAECCDDATVKYVEGASHWVQQDSPDEVNKYIREFLQ